MALTVLVIDDEKEMLTFIRASLRSKYRVTTVSSAKEALELLQTKDFDLILSDLRMPGMDGMEFLKKIRELDKNHTVIVMTAYGSMETAIEAMKNGAYDYIAKPFSKEELLLTLRKAEEREKLKQENIKLRSIMSKSAPTLIYRSKVMEQVINTIKRIAPYKTTVLLMGESGTGKELLAQTLHKLSDRSGGPFVAVNCGAIPESLIESELFGHEKGAFTDAVSSRKGLIEAAHKGTLFLDEIGELPLHLQVKLLRFIQEGETRRIGDVKPIKVDVRIVAATSRDLEKEVKEGRFREDLYYRLNVVPIKVPPLRERKEDIPALVEYFIKKTMERLKIDRVKGLTPEAMEVFMRYRWPGNVRELENLIERMIVLSDGEYLGIELLPDNMLQEQRIEQGINSVSGLSIKRHQRALEKSLIKRALEITKGNRTRAAKLLEISHRALIYKIKEYGLDKETFD